MAKQKRKLTAKERAEKRRRKREYEIIFVGGKQKRVKRPPLIDGLSVEEFIGTNADALWYHQNEMWEEIALLEENEKRKEIELCEENEIWEEIAANEEKMCDELGLLEANKIWAEIELF